MIADGSIPPTIAIMPDAPWSQRASYYVDSQYKGSDARTIPAAPVETAFTQDLIQHVDSTYRTLASRDGRVVGGYSMGGYGAIRYSLAHPDLFVSSIVLSPAVYIPKPPDDSSTREFGAFGRGRDLFSTPIYKSLNYPEELGRFHATGLKSHMFIAVGDDEYQNPGGYDARPRLRVDAALQDRRARAEHDRPSCASSTAGTTGRSGGRRSRRARSTRSSSSRGPRCRS